MTIYCGIMDFFFHFTFLAPQVWLACNQFGYDQSEYKDFLTPWIASEKVIQKSPKKKTKR